MKSTSTDLVLDAIEASGASDEQIREFMAHGMLSNVLLAIGADEVRAPWTRAREDATGRRASRCQP